MMRKIAAKDPISVKIAGIQRAAQISALWRGHLEVFIKRYMQGLRDQETSEDISPTESEPRPVAGRVFESGQGGADDVAVDSGATARTEKDSLRSRFDDASGRISRRCREGVNACYRRLSEEK